jgi:glycosyltransferase involved in cell wall biosynthesis/polysaccharide pyruvyl transferase WcaK-like protein/SAM-dependent methyltransferase
MSAKRLALFYGHIASNIGDLAINAGTLNLVRTAEPEAHLDVVLLNAEQSRFLDQGRASFGCDGSTRFIHFRSHGERAAHYLSEPGRLLAETGVADADLVLLAAGEHLFDYGNGENATNLFWRTLPAYAAAAAGKPCVVLPSTFGPFHGPTSTRLVSGLLEVASVAARDAHSHALLRSRFGQQDAPLLLDPAFFLTGADTARTSTAGGVTALAMRSEGWGIRLAKDHRATLAEEFSGSGYRSSRSFQFSLLLCRRILAETDQRIRVFVQSAADEELAQALIGELGQAAAGRIEAYRPISVHDYLDALRRVDRIVASRFHALVMALSLGVPACGVYFDAHGHKIPGLFAMLGRPERCLELSGTLPDRAAEVVFGWLAEAGAGTDEIDARLAERAGATVDWLRRALAPAEVRRDPSVLLPFATALGAFAAELAATSVRAAAQAEFERARKGAEATRAKLTAEREALSRALVEAEAAREALSRELETRERALAETEAAREALSRELETRERALTEAEAAREALSRELETRERALAEAEAAREALSRELETRERALAEAEAAREALSRELETRERALAEAEAAREALSRELETRERALAKAEAAREALTEESRRAAQAAARALADRDAQAERHSRQIADAAARHKAEIERITAEHRRAVQQFKAAARETTDEARERVKRQLSYRWGSVLVAATRRPHHLPLVPWRLYRAWREFRTDRTADATSGRTAAASIHIKPASPKPLPRSRQPLPAPQSAPFPPAPSPPAPPAPSPPAPPAPSPPAPPAPSPPAPPPAPSPPAPPARSPSSPAPWGRGVPDVAAVLADLETDRTLDRPADRARHLIALAARAKDDGHLEAAYQLSRAALAQDRSEPILCAHFWHAQSIGRAEEAYAIAREIEREIGSNPTPIQAKSLEKIRASLPYQLAAIDRIGPARPRQITPVSGRVCYVLHNSLPYASGGYATRGHGVATGLARAGHEVIAITRPGFPIDTKRGLRPEDIPGSDEIDGIRYIRALAPIRKGNRILAYAEQAGDVLEQQLRELRPEVVVAASAYLSALPALIAARRLGLPFIYEVRGFWEITRLSRQDDEASDPKIAVERLLETAVASHADLVFTLTEAMRDELVARGIERWKIGLLPNSVDPARFTPRPRDRALAARLGIPDDVAVIGYVGTFVDYEGLDDLAAACALLKQRGAAFRLLLVGNENTSGEGGGPITDQVRAAAAAGGFADWLILPGRVPHHEVEAYYSLIDIAPFPRKPWPVCEMVSPMKPLEALAMEKAVVVSSVRALAEMIADGQTGVVFAKGDVADLASKLEGLLADASLRTALGRQGRAWVSAERTWDRVGRTLHDEMHRLGLIGEASETTPDRAPPANAPSASEAPSAAATATSATVVDEYPIPSLSAGLELPRWWTTIDRAFRERCDYIDVRRWPLSPDVERLRALYVQRFGEERVARRIPMSNWARADICAHRVSPGGSLLDVGSGLGEFINLVALRGTHAHLTSMDIKTYDLWFDATGTIERMRRSIAELDASCRRDVVTCFEVIEHLPQDQLADAIDRLRATALRSLYVSVPFLESLPLHPGHRTRFDEERLSACFPDATFTVFGKGGTSKPLAWIMMEIPGSISTSNGPPAPSITCAAK